MSMVCTLSAHGVCQLWQCLNSNTVQSLGAVRLNRLENQMKMYVVVYDFQVPF